jgi:4-oxalocrotonate tautomerase
MIHRQDRLLDGQRWPAAKPCERRVFMVERPSLSTVLRIIMPTYHIEMMEGRTIEQKRRLVQEITRITVEVLGGSPESVDILITDVKRENWATGGKLWTEPRS